MQENLLAVIKFDCESRTAVNPQFCGEIVDFFLYRAARPARQIENKTKSEARVIAHADTLRSFHTRRQSHRGQLYSDLSAIIGSMRVARRAGR